ncbi:hypothetical protein HK102_000859, partial [Quaeritorhiza haematococci]
MDMGTSVEKRRTFEDSLLSLLQECGGTIRYLVLVTFYKSIPGFRGESDESDTDSDSTVDSTGHSPITFKDKLIDTIASSCPNLRGLEYKSDPPNDDERFEVTNTREDAIEKLLDKCGHLWTLNLDFRDGLDKLRFSDLCLKQRLKALE